MIKSEIHSLFKSVQVPKYLDQKIQELALEILDLKDMGKLRDTFDAQRFYDSLRNSVRSEYALKKHLGLNFNLDEIKNRVEPSVLYEFNDRGCKIVPFSSNELPKIPVDQAIPLLMVYLKPEKYAYVGAVITNEQVEKIIRTNQSSTLLVDLSSTEFNNINSWKYFDNEKELRTILGEE